MITLFNVRWDVTTAGPSPDNNSRTEVFLLGCNRAIEGNPCPGCFNSIMWHREHATITHDPHDVAKQIMEHAPNKYITIGGGEPTDQIEDLVILCKDLKEAGYHILVYTWRKLTSFLSGEYGPSMQSNMVELLKYIDILVDGEFILEERVYNSDAEDGCYNSVGSANQIVWDVQSRIGYAMRDIVSLELTEQNELKYHVKDTDQMKNISWEELE